MAVFSFFFCSRGIENNSVIMHFGYDKQVFKMERRSKQTDILYLAGKNFALNKKMRIN